MQATILEDEMLEQEEAKLELYALLGQGYKSIKEGKVSDIENVEARIMQRRKERA